MHIRSVCVGPRLPDPGRQSLDCRSVKFFAANAVMSRRLVVIRVLSMACAVLAVSVPAYAGLGRAISEAARDGTLVAQPMRQALQATAGAASAAAAATTVTVQTQTVQTAEGVTVIEYANAGGTVFALTWRGPFLPDFSQLFGQYFAPFKAAPRDVQGGLNLSRVSGSDIVVHSAGRMRGFVGVAWVPSLVPAGFDPAQLQP